MDSPRQPAVSPPLSSRRRGWFSPMVLMAVVGLAVIISSSQAEAQRRGRGGAAAAAARRKAMIASLQQRLNAARQLLQAAENQTMMSQAEVQKAVSALSDLRTSMESDQKEAAESSKSLHEIEDAILEKASDFRLVEQALDTAKEDLHLLLHKLIPRLGANAEAGDESCKLADMAKLSSDDRKLLADNADYQAALELMQTQAKAVAALRKKLFEADPQWVAAHKEAAEVTRKLRQEKAAATSTGIGSLDDRRNLRTAKQVAAEARMAIAECEAMLAQLGAKPAPPPKNVGSAGNK